jgi:RnfABCDGE-type electron transport complex D subunit
MEMTKIKAASPHVKGSMSTAGIMQMVLVALLPTSIFGIFHFGIRALLHMIVCITTCVLTEFTYEAFANKPLAVTDFSAAVTGLLLALCLPVSAPLWVGVAGGIFAIGVVKMPFGGIGCNRLNPALAGRCFLMIVCAKWMTDYTCDAWSGATPLALVKEGQVPDPFSLLLGTTGGSIGETCVLAILAGAILLLALGIINLRIPVSGVCAFILVLLLFGGKGFDEVYLVTELCGGGFLLGIWFMATDYTTSPLTGRGQILYGILIGILAAAFRMAGGVTEGTCYAILLANLTVPLIDRVTEPRVFGKKIK